MSRTTLCAITAGGLVTLSLGLMAGRYQVLGDEVLMPRGPRTWKVTMKVNGKSAGTKARLATLTPLDFDRQQIRKETFHSEEMADKPPTARHPERHQVLWSQRPGTAAGPFSVVYEFYCNVDDHGHKETPSQETQTLYAPPHRGEHLENEPLVESDDSEITALARRLVEERIGPFDQMQALFQHVDQQIGNEPVAGMSRVSAVACLKNGKGDAGAKSRLLVALCRNRGIPARIVTGLRLVQGNERSAHAWVEVWVRNHWLSLCPFHHHFGRVPSSYLVFGFGDLPIVRGRHVKDLDYAFLIEHTAYEDILENDAQPGEPPAESSGLRRIVRQLSLDALPGPERRLAEFLLLLPIAALIVCIYRNVIGLRSFGTFAPALVGLAFRDLNSFPGVVVFISVVLLGWSMRRLLDRYHLLQVPRSAVMLSLVVIVLVIGVVVANHKDLEATRYIPLFPIVILTGMIERFWTLEEEDGTLASLRTLLGTLLIAASIAVLVSWSVVINHLIRFPETLGIVMALQLLIGRYTGYRLMELFRFREFIVNSEK